MKISKTNSLHQNLLMMNQHIRTISRK